MLLIQYCLGVLVNLYSTLPAHDAGKSLSAGFTSAHRRRPPRHHRRVARRMGHRHSAVRFWAESGAPMNRRRAPAKDDQQQRSAALRWRLLLCDCERVLVMRADRFRVTVVVACSMPASDGGYIRLSEGDIAASCGSAVAAFVAVVSGRKR